jgi:hypothetical protein
MMRSFILVSILTSSILACGLPTIPSLTAPTSKASASAGATLFKDDFSSPTSGWDRTKYAEGIMDYDGGGYRILVNALQANFWSRPHKDFNDVRIEVDAGKLGGPDENRIGLICRSDGKNYYFFLISSDGYYGLGIFKDGKAGLLGQIEMSSNRNIHIGAAVNHLRADCKGNDLTFYVNGFQLATIHDSTLTHGDVGLLAGTFGQPGADIVFDNFVVLVP